MVTPHTQSCQEGYLAEDFPEPVAQPNTRRAHGRHMAGTIPGTIMVPEGRFRRVRVRLEEAFFDPDFAELLLKSNRICKIRWISMSLF